MTAVFLYPPALIVECGASWRGISTLPVIRRPCHIKNMAGLLHRRSPAFPCAISSEGLTLGKTCHFFIADDRTDRTAARKRRAPMRSGGASCYASKQTNGLRLFPPPAGVKGAAIRGFPSQRSTKRMSMMSSVHCAEFVRSKRATSRMANP